MIRRPRQFWWLLLPALLSQPALADRAFTPRYTVNQNGDMLMIGNTLLTCVTGAANCATAQAGGSFSNNDFTPMSYVDIDGSAGIFAGTFNSSSANLTMPGGAVVTFAGLYWGGESTNTARNQVLFRTPTAFGYSTVTASVVDNNTSVVGFETYQGFADVTSQVQSGGSGTYTVANVQADAGNLDHAGWTLVVVIESSTLPLRNFTVFDGYSYSIGTAINLTVSGFLTPLTGPMTTRLGIVAYDGDLDAAGTEVLQLNGTTLSNAVNAANNFYNSTISDLGVHVTSKSPNYVNQLGFDIDRVNVPAGILLNGATSATITVNGDAATERMWPGVVTFSTDLHIPIVTTNVTKTATDLNGGGLLVGDTLRWTIAMSNTGYDTANNLLLTDNIPTGTTYVANSLEILTGVNSGPKSDTSANDQAEYDTSGTPRVVFRLGTGANGTTGGSLATGEATSLRFDTTVDSGLAAGTEITNSATISYTGQTIGDTYGATSAAATATVLAPPTITKSFGQDPIAVGSVSSMSIVVANASANPATLTGVSFSDTYPSGLVNTASPSPQINCTAGSTAGTLTGGAAGGNTIGMSPGATLLPNGSCTITINVTSFTTGNYTNTTSAVTSTNGGTGAPSGAAATLSVGKPGIAKAFAPVSILSGGTSVMTLTLTNPGATVLTGVAFSDPMTNITVAATPGASNTCGGTFEGRTGAGAFGALAAGNTEVRLTGGTLSSSGSCTLSVNVTGTVTGVHPNATTGVSTTESGAAGNPSNTATLTIVGAPVTTKTFSPASVRTNTPSTLTITVTNPNTTTAITGVAFTDTYPTNLVNDTPANPTLNCTSGSTATFTGGTNGGTTVGISAGTLAAGGSCTVTVNVESATTGDYANSTGTVTTTDAGTGTAAGATLNVTNLTAPTVTKAFGAASIATGGTTALTITLTNPNAGTAVTGVSLTDAFPANLFVGATPGASNTCGGTFQGRTGSGAYGTIASGNDDVRLSGGTIPAAGNCAISVTVTSTDGGLYSNTTGTISTTNAGTFGPALASLSVLAPPLIAKSFVPDSTSIAGAGGESTLTITLSNPTTATTSLTGVSVLDPFPAGVIVDTPLSGFAAASTCDNAGFLGTIGEADAVDGDNTLEANDASIRVTGLTLAPNTSCTLVIDVSAAAAGNYNNTTNAVTSTNGGTGLTASAALAVGRPDLNKSFGTSPIAVGASSVMTLSLINPTAAAMTAAAVTDTFPAGMTVRSPLTTSNSCGGTLDENDAVDGDNTLEANDASIRLTGGTINANSTCTVTVSVTSTTTVTNTIPAGGLSTSAGTSANAASAVLLVYNLPTVTKSFSPTAVTTGTASQLSITLQNSNALAAAGVAFTDSFPANLVVATPLASSNTCGGTLDENDAADGDNTLEANDRSVRLAGGAIPANGSCVITVNVSSATAANYLNSTGTVTTTNIGTGVAASATLTVMAVPTVAKSFSPATIATNAGSTLSITLTNSNTVAITGAAFTDTYPGGLVNASTPGASTSCAGATVTATGGGGSLALTGATIPASGSCTVTVSVTSASAGSYNNSTGTVTTTNAGTGTAANGTLTVLARPLISKSFSPDPITSGGASTLTVTLTNPNTGVALTAAAFTDYLPFTPGTMTVASPLTTSNSCGGTLDENDSLDGDNTLEVGDGSVRLTGGTIPINSTCVVTIVVTAGTGGTYTNLIAAGALTSSGGSNAAAASDTLTVNAVPSFTLLKSQAVHSDPINGTSSPYSIPGAFMNYTILVTNSGSGAADLDTTALTDPIPANTDLFVGDLGVPGSGPVAFTDGTPVSGVNYTYPADLQFYSDAGCTTTVTPAPDGANVAANVNCIRINPKGVFAGDAVAGAPSPNFTVTFRVRVQ